MIKEVKAKQLLTNLKEPDPWFGLKYNMNIYRGCPHQCIYCDSRSARYQISDFTATYVKVNATELLSQELASKRIVGTIGTGSMSDPYSPVEGKYGLMRRALEIIANARYPVHIITKSDQVTRDLDLLAQISRTYAAVSITLTTVDDELARLIEPGAPPPTARLRAIEQLSKAGIYTGVTMMPILPLLTDSPEGVTAVLRAAKTAGAAYVIPWFGVTLRDRQRLYFYNRLDEFRPGLSQQYIKLFHEQYFCPARDAEHLQRVFSETCNELGLLTRMQHFAQPEQAQLRLF